MDAAVTGVVTRTPRFDRHRAAERTTVAALRLECRTRYLHLVPRRVFIVVVSATLLGIVAPFGCGGDTREEKAPNTDGPRGPLRLSETGLYAELPAGKLADGMLRFAPAHPLWADGAEKTRYLLLPMGSKVDTHDMNNWVFPVGTKAWKEFRVSGRLVETRFLWKRGEETGIESWWRMAYVWTPDGTDAVASVEGTPNALGTSHDVPSQEDCTNCHMHVRDAVIGFSAFELSAPSISADTDAGGMAPDASTSADVGRFLSLAQSGTFSDPPAADLVVPGSGHIQDALGYLHGNCGFCHNEQSERLIKRTMHLRLLALDSSPEQTGAYTTTFYTKMRHVMEGDVDEAIVPGNPDRSQLYRRMVAPDLMRMPPKGTKMVDETGRTIVRDWIQSL